MARSVYKTTIATCALIISAIGPNGDSHAQAPDSTLVDTPSQRWLPPPNPSPMQRDSQAKSLSHLRDRLLNIDPTKKVDAPRLSEAQVKSLMEAMRQLGDNLPEGLTPDSLDAIPPDLISKALSDPELMRQAKELAEKYSKKDRSKSAGDQSKPDDSATNKLSPTRSETGDKRSPTDRSPPSSQQADAPGLQRNAKDDNYKDLMEKLQNMQQRFAESQIPASEAIRPVNPESISRPPADANNKSSMARSPAGPELPAPPAKEGTKQPGSQQPNSVPSRAVPSSNPPSRTKPSQAGTAPIAENRSTQRLPTTERNRQSPSRSQAEPNPNDSTSSHTPQPPNIGDGSASSRASEPNSTSSMDIKKELERKGFGPTLQKIVEEAQRKSQASRATAHPPPTSPPSEPPPTKPPAEITKPSAAPAPSNRPARATNTSRPLEPTPRPPAPDSAFAKGLQETGRFLNSLWLQIATNNESPARVSASPSTTPQSTGPQQAFSLPNPFTARTLEYLIVFVALGAIAFYFLRFQSRSEQQRREILEAQSGPMIDEIRTRDDVVRAFHSLAKHRLKAAQIWWTCGYVTNRFEQSLPQHTSPIRSLACLYEQARYFPMEHDLTTDQIEEAKYALKQCRG